MTDLIQDYLNLKKERKKRGQVKLITGTNYYRKLLLDIR